MSDGIPERSRRRPRHPRNKLNDLNGSEWLYALRSVAIEGEPASAQLNDLSPEEWARFTAPVLATHYPTRGPQSLAHHIRRRHPSPKPPQILGELIRFFTRRDGAVLDPFAGSGGTLLACAIEGRDGVGVELAERYIALYHEAAAELSLPVLPLLQGDARHLDRLAELEGRRFDLVLTDPPYGSMLSRERTGERKKRGNGEPTPFTDDPADLGNLPLAVFLDALVEIVSGTLRFLRPGGHLVLFAKDLQPGPDHHNMLHADIVERLMRLDGLRYRGYRIWYDQSLPLYPFGYPYSFVANQVHQFILIFQHLPLRKDDEPS